MEHVPRLCHASQHTPNMSKLFSGMECGERLPLRGTGGQPLQCTVWYSYRVIIMRRQWKTQMALHISEGCLQHTFLTLKFRCPVYATPFVHHRLMPAHIISHTVFPTIYHTIISHNISPKDLWRYNVWGKASPEGVHTRWYMWELGLISEDYITPFRYFKFS